jgi:hypothetical protein
MHGYNNVYRLRFGGDAYRIVYRADSKNRRIIVRAVGRLPGRDTLFKLQRCLGRDVDRTQGAIPRLS